MVTVGRFTGGNRSNIVPDEVELEGTVRAFDESVRKDIHDRIRSIATQHRRKRRAPRPPWSSASATR